jgi:hypothetical protein
VFFKVTVRFVDDDGEEFVFLRSEQLYEQDVLQQMAALNVAAVENIRVVLYPDSARCSMQVREQSEYTALVSLLATGIGPFVLNKKSLRAFRYSPKPTLLVDAPGVQTSAIRPSQQGVTTSVASFGSSSNGSFLVTAGYPDVGHLGSIGSSAVPIMRKDAVDFARAVLVGPVSTTHTLYHGRSQIRAIFQVVDVTGASAVLPARVLLSVATKDALTVIACPELPMQVFGDCDPETGICDVLTKELAASCFIGGTITLEYGLQNSFEPKRSLGTELTLAALPTPVQGSLIYVEAPQSEVVSGESFGLSVFAESFPRTFWIEFEFANDVGIYPGSLEADAAVWNVRNETFTEGSTTKISVLATAANVLDEVDLSAGPSLLFILQFTVDDTASTAEISVNVNIKFLSSLSSVLVSSAMQPAGWLGRADNVVSIMNDKVLDVILLTRQSELVNTAAIDSVTVEVALELYAVTVAGRIKPASELGIISECIVTDPTVLQLNGCESVFLNGSETGPSAFMKVSAESTVLGTVQPFYAVANFHVWYPKTPLAYSIGDSTLSRILPKNTRGDDCVARYQQTTFRAMATFTDNTKSNNRPNQFNMDVTHLVAGHVTSSNNSAVAVIQTNSAVILSGIQAGVSTIAVEGAAGGVPFLSSTRTLCTFSPWSCSSLTESV